MVKFVEPITNPVPFPKPTMEYGLVNFISPSAVPNNSYHCREFRQSKMALLGYSVDYVKYQKIISHAIAKTGFLPKPGSEVFVKNLPHRVSDADLLEFFKISGDVFKIRILLNSKAVENRGFCYVTYMDPQMAEEAVRQLNRIPFKDNGFLIIIHSLNNCRIFLGGIPTHKNKDEVWQELIKHGVTDIVDIIMYRSYTNRALNRGFVFVEFKAHGSAARFRGNYQDNLELWGVPVIIDWSLPLPEVGQDVLSTVTNVFLRNLEVSQSTEEFESIIFSFMRRDTVQKVYKFKNYAFVHLKTRELAETLMGILKEFYKDTPVEIEWAKPASPFTSPGYRQYKISNLVYARSSNNSTSSSSSYQEDGAGNASSQLMTFDLSPQSLDERKKLGLPTQRCSSESSNFQNASLSSRKWRFSKKSRPTYGEVLKGADRTHFTRNQTPALPCQPPALPFQPPGLQVSPPSPGYRFVTTPTSVYTGPTVSPNYSEFSSPGLSGSRCSTPLPSLQVPRWSGCSYPDYYACPNKLTHGSSNRCEQTLTAGVNDDNSNISEYQRSIERIYGTPPVSDCSQRYLFEPNLSLTDREAFDALSFQSQEMWTQRFMGQDMGSSQREYFNIANSSPQQIRERFLGQDLVRTSEVPVTDLDRLQISYGQSLALRDEENANL